MPEQKTISLKRDPKRYFYEVRGASFLDRFTRATQDEPFLIKILSVIWVSGPVTLIALTMAYYVREKTLPEKSFIVYLMLFSFITGIVSIGTGLFKKAYYGEKEKEEQNKLLKVISFVPELILSIRNIYLRSLPHRAREIDGAYYLLQSPNLSSESVHCAIFDIFKNEELAILFSKLEIYRRRGLLSRVTDYASEIRDKYLSQIEDLVSENKMLSEHLLRRLDGYAPSFRKGKRRKANFLLNLQKAIDDENYDLFDLQDAEEFLKLLLEFLLGREFIVFRWYPKSSDHTQGIFNRYEKLLMLRRRKIMKYRKTLKGRKNKNRLKEEALASLRETNDNLAKLRKKGKQAFLESDSFSVVFDKSKVYLSEPEKIELIEMLEEKLPIIRSIVAIRKITQTIEDDEDTKQELMKEIDLKEFVIQVFYELSHFIDFTDLALVESIQSVRSINISGADIFETRKTKVGWLDTLMLELDENLNPVALETCQRIVNLIGEPLKKEHIGEILKNFNLTEEALTNLRPEDLSDRHPFFS